MRIIRVYYGRAFEMEGPYEGSTQFGKKMQRASEKCNISADRLAACKA